MRIVCEKCGTSYEVLDRHGGRMARCKSCLHRFVLPIPDEDRFFKWAGSCEWRRLDRFVTRGGARGHTESTIYRLIRIFETRRWAEEERIREETLVEERSRNMQVKKDLKASEQRRINREMQRLRCLEDLRNLTPTDFEVCVADIYKAQGYEAFAVGGGGDNGVDVEIFTPDGKTKWAIAQCKRYAQGNNVGSGAIRSFTGSYEMTGVQKGFFFTTSSYSRQAIKTASHFDWLTIYNGDELVKLIREVGTRRKKEAEQNGMNIIASPKPSSSFFS